MQASRERFHQVHSYFWGSGSEGRIREKEKTIVALEEREAPKAREAPQAWEAKTRGEKYQSRHISSWAGIKAAKHEFYIS